MALGLICDVRNRITKIQNFTTPLALCRHSAWVPGIGMIFLAHSTSQPGRRLAFADTGWHPQVVCSARLKNQESVKEKNKNEKNKMNIYLYRVFAHRIRGLLVC
jgi:hypothetical protein